MEIGVLKEKIENIEKEKSFYEKEVEMIREEVLTQKMKIAMVLNIAFETGGSELVEMIENAILE